MRSKKSNVNLQGLVKDLLGAPSEEAASLLEEHPELRTPSAIQVMHATQDHRLRIDGDGQSHAVERCLTLVCESDDAQAPKLIAAVADSIDEFTGRYPKPEDLRKFLVATQNLAEARVLEGCHHQLRANTHNMIGDGLTTAARYDTDPTPLLLASVDHAEQAVALSPRASPDLPRMLSNLAVCRADLYASTSERAHLDTAIRSAERAVDLTPKDSSDLPGFLRRLALHLAERYTAGGDRVDLETAISYAEQAVDLSPEGSANLPLILGNLALHLDALYALTSERAHLDAAIGFATRAVDLVPDDSPYLPRLLNNLAIYLADRYAVVGVRDDIEAAVSYTQRAADLTPENSVDIPGILNNLGLRHIERYMLTGDRDDLYAALEHAERSVEVAPDGSADRPMYLNNLANHHAKRYALTGERSDLEVSIQHAKRTLEITPQESIDFSSHLHNLALRHADLYALTGEQDGLDTATRLARQAVALTPTGSTDLPARFNSLANRLADRYIAVGDNAALKEAWDSCGELDAPFPRDAIMIARTKARILMLDTERDDSREAAARVLTAALGVFDRERNRLSGSRQGLRDLSGATEGLVADFAYLTAHIDPADAVAALDQPRLWLSPPAAADDPWPQNITTVWVTPSEWGTAIITQPAEDERHLQAQFSPVTRKELSDAAIAILQTSQPGMGAKQSAGNSDLVQQLIALASDITRQFLQVDRLLIIPTGIASQIPWYSCASAVGAALIDTTTITVAPTRPWALANQQSQPAGDPIGYFHPGIGNGRLDLTADRHNFEILTGQQALQSPDEAAVLEGLQRDRPFAHFSCHASYNHIDPLGSAIELGDPIQLRTIMEHSGSPWLINLSACETAVGDLTRTEQAISFPTGFLQAGAAHVIATLWPIRNDVATEFNQFFYALLNEGVHPADATRQAINHLRTINGDFSEAMIRSPTYVPDHRLLAVRSGWADPNNWAALTHYGNPA